MATYIAPTGMKGIPQLAPGLQKIKLAGAPKRTLTFPIISPDEIIFEGVLDQETSYDWVVPSGVTSISVVCIGGGASGEQVGFDGTAETGDADGGGGGNLRWINNVNVWAGETLEVVVGGGGDSQNSTADAGGVAPSRNSANGFSSYLRRGSSVIIAAGGAAGANLASKSSPNSAVSGAIGGGDGANGDNGSATSVGTGGNAGGYLSDDNNNNRAGARLYGLNKDGTEVVFGSRYGDGGDGDSTPAPASSASSADNGVNGAVRIIWGTGRSFPFDAA